MEISENKMNLLAVCLLSIVAIIGSVQCQDSLAKYVRVMGPGDLEVKALDWIANWMDGHYSANWQIRETSPSAMADRLERLRIKLTYNGKLQVDGKLYEIRPTVEFLVRLTALGGKISRGTSACTDQDVNNFVYMVKRFYGSLDVLASGDDQLPDKHPALFWFLRHYGKRLFDAVERRLEASELHPQKTEMYPDLWYSFEDLISSQASDGSRDSKTLAEVASSMDLASGNFNAKRMMKMVRSLGKATDEDEAKQLIAFIDERCHRYLMKFQSAINAINMYRILNGNKSTYFGLNKYSEYARLCYQFKDSETSAKVRHNIRKQLASPVKAEAN